MAERVTCVNLYTDYHQTGDCNGRPWLVPITDDYGGSKEDASDACFSRVIGEAHENGVIFHLNGCAEQFRKVSIPADHGA